LTIKLTQHVVADASPGRTGRHRDAGWVSSPFPPARETDGLYSAELADLRPEASGRICQPDSVVKEHWPRARRGIPIPSGLETKNPATSAGSPNRVGTRDARLLSIRYS
jgi:hypothetical protein